MKKLIAAITVFAFTALYMLGQNPTIVKPVNGVTLYPTNQITGLVHPGLYTNGLTAGTYYKWDGTNFIWASAGGGATPGSPTNSVQLNQAGSLGGTNELIWSPGWLTTPSLRAAQKQTNDVTAGGLLFLHGNQTIQFGNDAALFYDLRINANSQYYWGLTVPGGNCGLTINTPLGYYDANVTAGTTVVNNTSVNTMTRCDTSGGSIQIVLPAANQNNDKWMSFIKRDNTTNTVSVSVASGSIFEGGTNRFIGAQSEEIVAYCDSSSQWHLRTRGVYAKTWRCDQNDAQVITGNPLSYNVDTTLWYNILTYQSPPANGDTLDYGISTLACGTNYVMDVWYSKLNNAGILDVYIGNNKIGSIDQYAGATAKNQLTTLGPFSITNNDGRVQIKVNGKNGSSSDYYTYFNHAVIRYKP